MGDKGRSQLTRTEGHLYALSVADAYKVHVTFAQVSRCMYGSRLAATNRKAALGQEVEVVPLC